MQKRVELHVRLPAEIAVWLRELAERNGRTLNAEIVQRLRRSLEGYSQDFR